MILFKYIRPDRIDVVEGCEIRFTQPGALNDPFELRPQFESLIAEAAVLDQLATTPIDLAPMVKQAYAMLPEEQRSRLPFDEAAQFLSALLATKEARGAAATGVRTLLRGMRDGAAPAREKIYETLNSNVGLLSLSEVADHDLMWAHYAESHTGLVLAFDSQHSFFNRKRSEHDEFYFLRKVIYADNPPAPSVASLELDALLVTKGTKWAYEREWRMILPLADATRSLTGASEPMHLFAFPSDALRGVILGSKATATLEASVRHLLDSRRDLSHVHFCRATLDHNARSVKVPWPAPGGA